VKAHQVVAAMDCGPVVNLDAVTAQIQRAIEEPGVPRLAPAVANAFFNAARVRIRRMPRPQNGSTGLEKSLISAKIFLG